MKASDIVKEGLLPGALAGVVGGLVFGAAMALVGALPTVASLVRATSPGVGFIVHMVIAAVVGMGFGLLVWRQRPGAGELLFWGLAYGTFWWFLGPLTLLPLLRGAPLAWSVPAAQAAFPSLLGHLLYGASAGLVLAALLPQHRARAADRPAGALLRGALAGLLGALLLGAMLDAQHQLLAFAVTMTSQSYLVAWLVTMLIGVVAGLGFALLYPHPTDGAGAALIRGTLYGFLWWVVGALTLLPLIGGSGLAWSVPAARADFATLPGYLLFGAILALGYQWLGGLWRILFADASHDDEDEGPGVQGLRAIGRGTLAGLVGGLLFTVVMVQVGFLPIVASIVGSTSPLTGFVVHLVISDLIGIGYGLLFSRRSYDVGSALGWGVSYGFFWWILGPLTILPVLLGTTPQWTVEVATGLFASLVGHLAYGAGLGLVFYLLEARSSPWWVGRTRAEERRAARRKEQVLTSAPALWVLTVAIALIMPVVLGM